MPKKSKRQVRKAPAAAPAPEVLAAPTLAPQSGPARLTTAAEFNPDYTYVVKDLRRIGILALVFVIALVILTFFI